MKFYVVIKDKMITVHAADGVQSIQWLVDSAQVRYDENMGTDLGYAKEVRLKNGQSVSFQTVLNTLSDESQIFVLYGDDIISE